MTSLLVEVLKRSNLDEERILQHALHGHVEKISHSKLLSAIITYTLKNLCTTQISATRVLKQKRLVAIWIVLPYWCFYCFQVLAGERWRPGCCSKSGHSNEVSASANLGESYEDDVLSNGNTHMLHENIANNAALSLGHNLLHVAQKVVVSVEKLVEISKDQPDVFGRKALIHEL